ncbi:TPA: hypothetical protein PXQ47_003274 [Yersinia enterocolitica]|nr:hypothetical protein [Yersinia enterocolitica]
MSLEEIRSSLLTTSETTGGLLALIHDLYGQEIRSEKTVLSDALVELHNSGEIDLVEIVRGVDKNSCGTDFFIILSIFENTLPLLNSRVDNVLHCLVHLTELADGDLTVYGLYGAFERFCSKEAYRPRDSIECILKQSELSSYAPFLSSAILAYNSGRLAEVIQTTESLITSSNDTVRNQVYLAWGRLSFDETHTSIIWRLLSNSASSEHKSGCRASILRAMLQFGETFPLYWPQIEKLLITFVKGAPPEVLNAISSIVSFQRVELPKSVLHLLVKQLANVSPEHKSIIDNIDHLLVKLVGSGSSSLAVELLESILARGVKFKSLDYFSNQLLSKYQKILNYIVTKWFLYGEASLCHSVLELLTHVTGKDIELKAEVTLLDNKVKQVFVSRKAVGWLFTRPIATASFILSISEATSTTTHKELEEILYDPLLLSYPGELKRFFQSCIDKGVQKHLCERLLGKLEAYHADIEKVSELKELMAPNENVSAYWRDFDKDMQEAHEAASKSSFIRMFAKTQKLLYGNSSIYYSYQLDGKSVRQEMQMHSFSHSTEIPRLNVLDPESLDYILRVYRHEKMKNEINS